MARRRRPGSRTSLVDARAELIVPIEAFATADDGPLSFGDAKNWMSPVSAYPSDLAEAGPAVALVVDGFAYDLHLGDLAFATDIHEGEAYRDRAVSSGVDVYITNGLDPRRSTPGALSDAAATGAVLGAHLVAFGVDKLSE